MLANEELMGAELLAAVYASPNDDAPRAVYADWLLERNDPRGEFIALQLERTRRVLTKEEEDRLSAIAHKNAAKWIPKIAPVTQKKSWVFERGFLDACTINAAAESSLVLEGLLTDEWRTVREIDLDGGESWLPLQAAMRRLRSVKNGWHRGTDGVINELLTRYPAIVLAPIESLEINTHFHDLSIVGEQKPTVQPSLRRALIECRSLPSLTQLHLLDPHRPEMSIDEIAWLWRESRALGKQLREIGLGVALPSLVPTITALASIAGNANANTLERVVLRPDFWDPLGRSVQLSRGTTNAFTVLTIRSLEAKPFVGSVLLLDLLRAIAADALEELHLQNLTPSEVEQITEAVGGKWMIRVA